MIILQIEHTIVDYESWKQAFDRDPIQRVKSGVRRYRVAQPANDPQYVIVDLEFDEMSAAEATLAALQELWDRVEGTIMINPQTRILRLREAKEY